jgi:signal transduction histidine kinase/DNA-binding response OmpR family regulator
MAYESWAQRVHPDDRSAAEAALRAIHEGVPSTQFEFRLVRPDGTVRHVEAAAAAVLGGQGQLEQIVGVNRDVTERVEAEQQRIRLVRELGERVHELRLLHAAASMLQPDRPSDEALFQELVRLIPQAWHWPAACEARICAPGICVTTAGWAETRWKFSTTFRIGDGEGSLEVVYRDEPSGSIDGPSFDEKRALLESVAEMIVGHAELRRHHDHLEELVATKTRQLQIAVEAADRASRAKSTFLATMSHEIRTPMNAILGYAQLLRRDRSLSAGQREKIETILSSGDHLLYLINNVLEMSKIEAGRTTLMVGPFDLHALLDGLHLMFRELARAKELELRFSPFQNLPRIVEGDCGKVRQVLINLVSNAMKFTTAGHVAVSTQTTLQPDGRHRIAIEVADTGPGIACADFARVFHVFEQSSAGGRAGGTGLGLPISRELARLMEGDVTVTSEPAAGSVFCFSFMATASTAPVPVSAPAPGTAVGLELDRPIPKVLVVDDQAQSRALLRELLSTVGFDTRVAQSCAQALATHDAWTPDLMLIDLAMPEMEGVTIIRTLRGQGSSTRIVALTASGLEHESAEAVAAGAQEVLRKPYREALLLERVGALLDVRYVYALPPGPRNQSGLGAPMTRALSDLLAAVPEQLTLQLREAVLAARPGRIHQLAGQIAIHSTSAAAQITALAQEYAYDALAAALEPRN